MEFNSAFKGLNIERPAVEGDLFQFFRMSFFLVRKYFY